MKIIVDGFGGDNSPLAPLQAASLAVKEYNIEVILTGKKEELEKCSKENNVDLKGITFVDASLVMPVEAEPNTILKEYKDSSMAVGLKLLADGEGDAFISAGSTGALVFGSTFIVKRIKKVKRPVIALNIPTMGGNGHYLLIDAGANSEVRPEMLTQFAIMGSVYQKTFMKIDSPKVALINIGAEETKGTELQVESYKQLKNAPVNFIGNIEARGLPLGGCDVAVCDGFTGNIVLKMTEGMASFFSIALKKVFYTNALSKIAGLLIKKPFSNFKKTLDYKEVGGVPILGVTKPVIKAHGSSDAKAIKNAIRQAVSCVENEIISKIETEIVKLNEGENND